MYTAVVQLSENRTWRNDMEKVALEQAGSQILSMNINEKTTRYILSFPKEIS